jgi:hypothetical protein
MYRYAQPRERVNERTRAAPRYLLISGKRERNTPQRSQRYGKKKAGPGVAHIKRGSRGAL